MMMHCRRSFINVQAKLASRAFSSQDLSSLFNPTDEHRALRSMLRSFVKKEVCQPELFWIIPSRVFLVVPKNLGITAYATIWSRFEGGHLLFMMFPWSLQTTLAPPYKPL